MVFIWLLLGIVATVVAFSIPDSSQDLWPALNSAGVVIAVYLVALLIYALRPPLPARKRIIVGSLAVIGMLSVASAWTGHEMQSRYQRELLLRIRTVIGRGVLLHEMPDQLLPVLEEYHNQREKKSMSLEAIFLQNFPDATVGVNYRTPQWQGDTSRWFIPLRLEEDLIEIIAVDRVGRGKDPDFENAGGFRGRLQERFVLTEKGVSHDILN